MTASCPPSPFRSFIMGGFEGSAHRRPDGAQLDLIAATGHDRRAGADYRALAGCGVLTVRDAFRWHLIEAPPGRYDWSSVLPMVRAAREAGVQPVWDLCHYGLPHDLDIWTPAFVDRFAAFCAAAARLLRDEGADAPVLCPVNEVSYWAGGDKGLMHPGATGRGAGLKAQLVRAAIAGTHAVRAVSPGARFTMAEPLINVVVPPEAPRAAKRAAAAYRAAQFEAFDMVAGRQAPELGGSEDCLDLVGLNYYPDNQFFRGGAVLPMGHWMYQPLRDLLREVHARYGRPVLLAETGAEGGNGPGWLRYVMGEVGAALDAGVPVQGVCLYPVMDYPGWRDNRHCRCGLLRVDALWGERTRDAALARVVRDEAALIEARAPAAGAAPG